MHRPPAVLVIALFAAATALPAQSAAQGREPARVGTLACDISGGAVATSKKEIACIFTPAQPGPREVYIGSIAKSAPDVAKSGGEMIWSVLGAGAHKFGALAGHYGGAGARMTAGPGVGADLLVGGSKRSVTLQPVTLQGEAVNVAAGIAEIDLRPAR